MRVRFGDFTLDTDERLLSRDGTPVHLTPKALALLECLVEGGHAAVPKRELLSRIWPSSLASESSLTSAVKEVRRALGDSARGPRYLRGVRGFGYAFCADLRVEPAPPATKAAAHAPLVQECRVSWRKREIALAEGENLLGRVHEAAVWVEHPSVSRRHAVIRVAGGQATIEDCGSKNGTFLRGERITGPRELCAGDELWLGRATLRYSVYATDASTGSDDSGEPPS
jgi:DNA-binding winged helix-turn-helix (wHTH) protein